MQHMKGKDRKRMRRSARKLSALALAAILACTNAASCVNVSYAAELSDKESEDSDSKPAENGGNGSSEQDADSEKTESEDSWAHLRMKKMTEPMKNRDTRKSLGARTLQKTKRIQKRRTSLKRKILTQTASLKTAIHQRRNPTLTVRAV